MKRNSLQVKDILKKKNIIIASPDETLSSVLARLSSSHDAAFLFDDKNNFCGAINPYYCAIKRSYPARTKALNCRIHPPRLFVSDPVERAARLMMESKIHYLPVFGAKREFLGIATAHRVMNAMIKEKRLSKTIGEFLETKKPPVTIFENDTLAKALSLFKSERVSKLIVVGDNFKLKGVLAFYDIIDYITYQPQRFSFGIRGGDRNPVLQKKVRNFYKNRVLTLTKEDTLEKAASLIISENIGSVIAVDGFGHPLGIITTKDILSETISKKPQPVVSFIPVNLSKTNLSLARVYVSRIGSFFLRKRTPEKAIIKIEEKKKGGIFEIALSVFTKGKPVKVIKKQGKNIATVFRKFAQTVATYFSKK